MQKKMANEMETGLYSLGNFLLLVQVQEGGARTFRESGLDLCLKPVGRSCR